MWQRRLAYFETEIGREKIYSTVVRTMLIGIDNLDGPRQFVACKLQRCFLRTYMIYFSVFAVFAPSSFSFVFGAFQWWSLCVLISYINSMIWLALRFVKNACSVCVWLSALFSPFIPNYPGICNNSTSGKMTPHEALKRIKYK